jgi:hypothetical protein
MLRNKAIGAGKTISDDVDEITTLTGEQGWEYLAYKDEGEKGRFYYRDTAFTDANGRVVLFTMVAAYPLDVRDVDDLMRSFSAGPDEGTRTPKRLFDGSQPPQQPDQGLPDSGAADGGLP